MIHQAVLVAVGHEYSRKSEVFENDMGMWIPIDEFPIDDWRLWQHAALYNAGHHYFFGGERGQYEPLKSIYRLEESTWKWSDCGEMTSGRRSHSVILVEGRFMLIGGVQEKKNEACLLKNDEFSCTQFTSSFDYYKPVLYLVDQNDINC